MPDTSWMMTVQRRMCPERVHFAFQGIEQPILDHLAGNIRAASALAEMREFPSIWINSGELGHREAEGAEKVT